MWITLVSRNYGHSRGSRAGTRTVTVNTQLLSASFGNVNCCLPRVHLKCLVVWIPKWLQGTVLRAI
jgi:hypothetical protein